jgi:chaperonin GroES
MSFTPLHDRILVRRAPVQEKSKGGIYIPDNGKEASVEGVVVSAGKGKIMENGNVRPLDVKEGDTVLFGKYSGTEIMVDDEPLLIMREEEVSGIVEYRPLTTEKLTS